MLGAMVAIALLAIGGGGAPARPWSGETLFEIVRIAASEHDDDEEDADNAAEVGGTSSPIIPATGGGVWSGFDVRTRVDRSSVTMGGEIGECGSAE